MWSTGRLDVVDPDVGAFFVARVVSFAAWDLFIYLNRDPETCQPLSRLAAMLARGLAGAYAGGRDAAPAE